MKIESSAFRSNEKIPARFTCDGDNVSPALKFSEIPPDAQSLALVMDDPDAPAGTWVHWLVWNISPKISEISENSVPMGAELGTTSFGKPGYGGPCPPSGTHHYYFKLYALDRKLDLSETATKRQLESATTGHILDQAELIGLYNR